MARLPQPGGDSGNWGDILNDYLAQSHKADGSIKESSIGTGQLQSNSVTSIALAPNSVTSVALAGDSVTSTTITDGSVTNTKIAAGAVSKSQLQPALVSELDAKLIKAVADDTYAPIEDIPKTSLATSVQSSLAKADAALAPSARSAELLATQRSTALAPFWAALGNRDVAACNILTVGGSHQEGEGATQIGRRYVSRTRDRLRQRLGVAGGGDGFIAIAKNANPGTFTYPITLTGPATTTRTDLGIAQATRVFSEGAGFTFTFTGTSFDIHLQKTSAANTGYLDVVVDGAAAVRIDHNTVAGSAGHTVAARITATGTGPHTVSVSVPSGTDRPGKTVMVSGVMIYNGDEIAGLRMWNGGRYGNSTLNWINSVTLNGWLSGPKLANPDLVVFDLGVNDQLHTLAGAYDIPPAVFVANIQTVISAMRTLWARTFSVVLLIGAGPNTAGYAAGYAPWQEYVDAMWTVAASDPLVTVADFSLRLPVVPASPPGVLGLYTDVSGHQTDKGHGMKADLLTEFLLPR